jgi:phage recombination protein Bet
MGTASGSCRADGIPILDDAAMARVLRRTKYCHLSEDQFELLIITCQRRGLDPWLDQVYAITETGSGSGIAGRSRLLVLMTIQGLRDLAESTGQYGHQLGPFWCGPDRRWRRGWVNSEPPTLARVGVVRNGAQANPFWGVARWDEAAQFSEPPSATCPGRLAPSWARMPSFMLAKVAEAMALRKAFPSKLGGLYTDDEIDRTRSHGGAGDGLGSVAMVDEGTPTSEFLFQMRLVRDFEFANAAERERVIEEFRGRYADLHMRDRRGFYAAVLHDLSQTPTVAVSGEDSA